MCSSVVCLEAFSSLGHTVKIHLQCPTLGFSNLQIFCHSKGVSNLPKTPYVSKGPVGDGSLAYPFEQAGKWRLKKISKWCLLFQQSCSPRLSNLMNKNQKKYLVSFLFHVIVYLVKFVTCVCEFSFKSWAAVYCFSAEPRLHSYIYIYTLSNLFPVVNI